MKGKLFTIVAIALFLTLGSASSGLQAADSIKAYMGFSREVNEALAARIQEKVGIEVKNITLSWGEIWARVKTEYPRFNADMVLSFGASEAINGAQKGYYEAYHSPAWDSIGDAFKSPDGTYYALGTFSFLLIGNKEKLAEKGYGMPMSWKELERAFGSQMERPDCGAISPNFGYGIYDQLFFPPTVRYHCEKEGWKFLESLDKNMAFYTKSGNAPTDLVGRGEYLLGLTADENVLKRINDGYPIVWTVPVEGTGYEGNYCTILKGTEKLALCQKVMDYLGSEDASQFLGSMGYIPPRTGITSALYGAATPKFIKLDHSWAVKNKRKVVKQWKSKFMMKETAKAKKVGDEKEKKAAQEE